ncbi:RICIN domain-containing protein [Mangrovihabitans endophyticus]|uniref:RICIN domain-containing protein n=1 Tax=Mangrovihabitans endophyticus TaxID=1751298 RepID=UPI001668F22F|nr:RICIN domain-containing protein [Mangrovihabitans endophyticus]
MNTIERIKARRLAGTSMRARTEIIALALTLSLTVGLAFTVVPALASADKLKGTPVPDKDVASLVAAALSCPALSPQKLAAQLMATSAFGNAGGKGIAAMSDTDWSRWRPWPGAGRGDHAANILAVAHRTCETVGSLRAAGVKGDLWSAALAADKVGVRAVIDAKGVPEAAQDNVRRAGAYANWYAEQPEFTTKTDKNKSTKKNEAKAMDIPAGLVSDVTAAGRICPTVTPVRLAAQLRALSNFNPNLQGPSGAQGIAQFTPDMWEEYSPGDSTSPWNPDDAISALGTAMCDLTDQFAGLSGTNPYVLALGAYQWGPDVIRQAGGLPRTTVPQLVDRAQRFTQEYQKDPRLAPHRTPATSPAPATGAPHDPTPGHSPSAKPSPNVPASKTQPPMSAPPAPAADKATPVKCTLGAGYRIQNVWAGAVLDVPGDNVKHDAGTRVDMWKNTHAKDQVWTITKAPADGYVIITNKFTGLVLAVEKKSSADRAKLVLSAKLPKVKNQQWKLIDAGNGQIYLQNHLSGKVMDLLGNDLGAPRKDGTWNGSYVQQFQRQPRAHDQRWRLLKN